MPIEQLYISRVTDGLVLVLSNETIAPNTPQAETMEVFKGQAKQLLKKIHVRSTARMSIDSNPFIFHYIIENGICYLALTEKGYPKRLAFLFLEEISREFTDYLKLEYGEEAWQRTVETIGRQYAFIKFDRVIQKKRREYSDPNSANNMRKLNEDLASIQNVMRKTIDDVLERGNKLDNVSEISKSLASESKKYKWYGKKLSFNALVKQYMPLITLLGIVIVVFAVRFFKWW
jgi:vesicle transport protein SEC22